MPAGQTANATVTVTNLGSTSAALGCFYLDSLGATACGQSSAAFALSGLPQLPDTLPAEGTVTFTVSYTASGDASGDTDQLDVSCIAQGSSNSSVATDPLLGNVSLTPCSLTITPSTINFGTVALGTPVVATTTLGNVGQTTCNLTVSLDGASDPSFTLDPSQAANFSIPAGGTAQVTADFNLDSSQPPNTRTGAIDYQSNDPNHATGQIPMTATL